MEQLNQSTSPEAPIAPKEAAPLDLSKESIGRLSANGVIGTDPKTADQQPRNVLRVTNSVAQYNVSPENPDALSNIGKALAGSLDRDDFTYFDPESKKEIRIGDVLVSVDLRNKDAVVLCHRDSAGKGMLGRLACSLSYINENPLTTVAMKALGLVADPEIIYQQKIIQILSQLDREGLFGPPGSSSFSLSDWDVDTRSAWRDVVIKRAQKPEPLAPTPALDALRVPTI